MLSILDFMGKIQQKLPQKTGAQWPKPWLVA